jgi:vancomycin permeability regulator SanA
MSKKFKRLAVILILTVTFFALAVLVINLTVVHSVSRYIVTQEDASSLDADYILILGCGLREDGSPSHMLYDRTKTGSELWLSDAGQKILASGDHGRPDYNEVGAMMDTAHSLGVELDALVPDYAGFSTYDSIYRAKSVYGAKKVIIVTQQYHLYRAVYLARQMGIEAYGVSADLRPYAGQLLRDAREFVARVKDFFMAIALPDSEFLGTGLPYTLE